MINAAFLDELEDKRATPAPQDYFAPPTPTIPKKKTGGINHAFLDSLEAGEHPEVQENKAKAVEPPRKYEGFWDELGRSVAGGSLNVASGMTGTLAETMRTPTKGGYGFGATGFFDRPEYRKPRLKKAKELEAVAQQLYEKAKEPAFAPAEGGGVRGFVAQAVGNAFPYMATATVGAILAGPVGAFGVGFSVEGDNAYREAISQGATEEEANLERMIVGTINGAIEQLQVGGIFKFAKKGKGAATSIIKAAKDRVWKKLAKAGGKLTKDFLRHSINEGIEEALQESVSMAAPAIHGRGVPGAKEFVTRAGKAGLGGAVAGGVLGGAGALAQRTQVRGDIEAKTQGQGEIRHQPIVDKITEKTGIVDKAAEKPLKVDRVSAEAKVKKVPEVKITSKVSKGKLTKPPQEPVSAKSAPQKAVEGKAENIKIYNSIRNDIAQIVAPKLYTQDAIKKFFIDKYGKDPEITLYRGITPERKPEPFVSDTISEVGKFWTPDYDYASEYSKGGDIYEVKVKASNLVRSGALVSSKEVWLDANLQAGAKISKAHPAEAVAKPAPAKAEVKPLYTSVPEEWHGKTLYDWGQKGLRGVRKGEAAIKVKGQRSRKIFIWRHEFTEIPTRTPKALAAVREKTDEVFLVKSRKGNYYLAPTKAVEQVRAELGEEAFERVPAPVRTPLQKINDVINSTERRGLSDSEIGAIIEGYAQDLGLTTQNLSDKQKKYIEVLNNDSKASAIRQSFRTGMEQAVQPTKEELEERKAIQEEAISEEVGDFLDGIEEEVPTPTYPKGTQFKLIKGFTKSERPYENKIGTYIKTVDDLVGVRFEDGAERFLYPDQVEQVKPERQKDLLGRPMLRGGAVGKQAEFLEKEKYRLPEPDIKGQMKIPEKPSEAIKKAISEQEFITTTKPAGGAGGASVAAAGAGEGAGYGTIAPSEKSTFAKETQMHRVSQELPKKTKINVLDELLKIASPAHRVGSREGARVLRKNLGKLSQETVVAHETLRKIHRAFTFMNRDDIYDFIDRLENGQEQLSPRLTQIAQKFRSMLDERRDAVQALGKGQLQNFYENYFPHIWKDPKAAEKAIMQIFGKRKFEGSKTFLKKRTLMTIKEGREVGLELVSENPVDLVLLKIFEMDRYLMAHHVIQDLKSRNLIKFVYSRSPSPEGYKKIDDRAFTVYMPPEIIKKEAYDSIMVDQLMDIARSLGIDAQRFVSLGKGRGRWWGYAQIEEDKVRTRYAGHEGVLTHEIGHVLNSPHRYNVYEILRRAKEGGYQTITRGKRKGEQKFVPTEAAVEHRKTIDKEWRALADARYKDKSVTKGFKKYVRKTREKEAVMLEALIHAPDEFKRVAPHLYKGFTKFLNEHSELRPILDIKPSLVLGTSEAKIPVPGFTVLGHYYAPEPVAKILNNYLSPGLRNNENFLIASGYNMTRMAANILNQAQLALSGFHALNVTTDMMASTLGQGVRRLTVKGQRIRGVGDIVSTPISPVLRLWDGVRLRKAYKKQVDTIENDNLRNMVKAVVLADGRDRMDPFYYNQQIKALKTTIGELVYGAPKQKIKGAFKLPFNTFGATLEALAKPLMEWYVPTGKLGLFTMLAQHEMQRAEAGQINPEQLHERLISSWDSVDNRMGQLVYDNLFWNKYLKDVLMLAVRSVGWNLGSWREYGGVPADILGTKGRLERGDVLLSQKMAYTIGAVTLYAALGAMIMYLLTGKTPEEPKDYFFPKTGRKNPDGSDERLSLPTYAKDWFAYGTQPIRTIKNKLHPLWGLLTDVATNKDFFNVEVRHPGDPISQQLLSVAEHIGREFLPLSVRNYKKMQKAEPSGKNIWVSITGITSAPSYITRSPAQKLMYRYIVENIPDKTKTKEQQKLYEYRRTIKNRLRKGDPVDSKEVIAKIGKASFNRLVKDAKKEPFAEAFGRLSLYQALNVYAIASEKERLQTKSLLKGKYNRARKITPEMKQLYKELIK